MTAARHFRFLPFALRCAAIGMSGMLACLPAASAKGVRLSDWLTAEEQTEAGFEKLSLDEIAVVNALAARDAQDIRREQKQAAEAADGELPLVANFSARRSEHEWAITGLEKLTAKERERLDALVAAWTQNAPVASRPTPFITVARDDDFERNAANRPKIGGSIALTYGMAEGGGTLRSGSMVLTYDDPKHGFSAVFGYSTTKADGGFVQPRVIYGPPPPVQP